MRTFGLILLFGGIIAFLYCTSRLSQLSPVPAEVAKRFDEEKYLMTSFIERVNAETKRIKSLPGGDEFIKQFETNAPGLMSAVKR